MEDYSVEEKCEKCLQNIIYAFYTLKSTVMKCVRMSRNLASIDKEMLATKCPIFFTGFDENIRKSKSIGSDFEIHSSLTDHLINHKNKSISISPYKNKCSFLLVQHAICFRTP